MLPTLPISFFIFPIENKAKNIIEKPATDSANTTDRADTPDRADTTDRADATDRADTTDRADATDSADAILYFSDWKWSWKH